MRTCARDQIKRTLLDVTKDAATAFVRAEFGSGDGVTSAISSQGRGRAALRAGLVIALALLGSVPALAADPSGCDKFKWPIDKERAPLTGSDRAKLASGAADLTVPAAMTLDLKTPADAKLPKAPERKPKDGTFAGFSRFQKAPKAGAYTISLSSSAWVDVVQDGETLKPMDFSAATDCAGIRKTIKYDLAAGAFLVQVSGVAEKAIDIAVLPSE